MKDAIDSNRERGILTIVAAGNSGTDNDLNPSYPSNYFLPNIIAVAATDRNDGIASFSQFGSTSVHIGAPGVAILSTTRNDTYQSFNGTSMAAPHVAGVAALMRAQNPSWDWLDIKNRILAGGDNTSAMSGKTVTGKRLNVVGSLTCSNSVLNARLQPLKDKLFQLAGDTVNLASLHINCGDPNGSVSVSVSSSAGNSRIDLEDDGLGNDLVAGDGIYSGTYTVSTATDQSLTFPGGDVAGILFAPTNLTATTPPTGVGQIDLSWEGSEVPVQPADHLASTVETMARRASHPAWPPFDFHVERALASTRSTGHSRWSKIAYATVLSYLDAGLACNTTYDYRVRANDHGGGGYGYSDYSNTATATTADCPSAPTSLTATPVSPTEINVSWQDNSSDETEFHLWRYLWSTRSWSLIAFPTASSYLDTGLTCNAMYSYAVRAHRHGDNGFSGYSNTATRDDTGLRGAVAIHRRRFRSRRRRRNLDRAPHGVALGARVRNGSGRLRDRRRQRPRYWYCCHELLESSGDYDSLSGWRSRSVSINDCCA